MSWDEARIGRVHVTASSEQQSSEGRQGTRHTWHADDTECRRQRRPSRRLSPAWRAGGTSENDHFTVGVEEELLLVDRNTRHLRPWAEEILPNAKNTVGEGGQVDREFKLSQVETGTPVCKTPDELTDVIARLGAGVITAAEGARARSVPPALTLSLTGEKKAARSPPRSPISAWT